MTGSSVPDFFDRFPMRRVHVADLDDVLGDGSAALDLLFLWGHDCPNCDIAKRSILAASARFVWPAVRWLQGNVYAEPELGTRFGLHGSPAFFVFRSTRKLGRISPWPGPDAFVDAIDRQIAALDATTRGDDPTQD